MSRVIVVVSGCSALLAQMFLLFSEAKAVLNMGWCPYACACLWSLAACNRGADAEEIAIGDTRSFETKLQSYGLKKLFRHRPRDVVARASGLGDVDETVGYEPEA